MAPASVLRKIRSNSGMTLPPGYIDLRTARHVTKSGLAKIPARTLLIMSAQLDLDINGEKIDYVRRLHDYWVLLDTTRARAAGISEVERLLLKPDYIGRNAFHKFRRGVLREMCLRYKLLPGCARPSKGACELALWQWHQQCRLASSSNGCARPLSLPQVYNDGQYAAEDDTLCDFPALQDHADSSSTELTPSPSPEHTRQPFVPTGADMSQLEGGAHEREKSVSDLVVANVFRHATDAKPVWILHARRLPNKGIDLQFLAKQIDQRRLSAVRTYLTAINPSSFQPFPDNFLDKEVLDAFMASGFLRLTFEEHIPVDYHGLPSINVFDFMSFPPNIRRIQTGPINEISR